jgi:hypothetical protein
VSVTPPLNLLHINNKIFSILGYANFCIKTEFKTEYSFTKYYYFRNIGKIKFNILNKISNNSFS